VKKDDENKTTTDEVQGGVFEEAECAWLRLGDETDPASRDGLGDETQKEKADGEAR
jgi:hypothetical protein